MQENVLLKDHTTMRLGGPSAFFATAKSQVELEAYIDFARKKRLPLLVMGEGSNLIIGDSGFEGLAILNRMEGFEVISESSSEVVLRVGSGERWDHVVSKSVGMGLSGIEAMSAIPGYAGAAPVQNIGAYGQEVADTLVEVEAYDLLEQKIILLSKDACHFSYRKSIFNGSHKSRFILLNLFLKLSKQPLSQAPYDSLSTYMKKNGFYSFEPYFIREAVIKLRSEKLPDPKVLPNSGSFFKNPFIPIKEARLLQDQYPAVPIFPTESETCKVSAGWLIDQCNLKGFAWKGMRVYDKNALVLVNEGAENYEALQGIREHVITTVKERFGILLSQEPEEIHRGQ